MLVAYADESGTHDKLGKSSVPVVAFGGYVATRDEWGLFTERWQRVLNDYDAPFFHFREWAIASAIVRKLRKADSSFFNKNPYCGWKLEKLDSFLMRLAEVANTRKSGTFGGYLSTKEFQAAKAVGRVLIGEDPFDYCLKQCFESFTEVVHERWPHYSGPISFVWDDSTNAKWRRAIRDSYESFKQRDPRLQGIVFDDKKNQLPLQAADMSAYRIRQKTDKHLKNERAEVSILDEALFFAGAKGRLLFRNTN